MKFDIMNRYTGKLQFSAEINCEEDTLPSIKIGLAIRWAYKAGADLRGADLRGADLRGADLRGAYLRGADLRGADLRGAYLRGADLRGADLRGAYLGDADLRGANLGGANLGGANLRDADLRDAYLRDADLRDAYLGGAEIPIVPNIDAAILASIEANKAAGKNGLKMSKWHGDDDCNETNWCNTTHCRAGYAICLAGAAGFELERKVGPDVAGALIYAKSRPDKPVPNFYASDDEAMADIRKCAMEQP
jgi:uncharacterized protein YjbI with pentapeptide repeats